MFLSLYTFKTDFLREQLFTSLRNSIIYFSPPPPLPRGHNSERCVNIYVRCAYSCVSSPFMYPSEIYTLQNSSSCLLINKMLCSLISCLLFPVVSSLPSFCAYANTWHYHARLNAQKHSCFLLTSSRFFCSVTKLQEQGRAAKELKPHSLILKKPSSLLLLLLFVFLPHILCHVVITGTLMLCTRDKCTSQQDTEGLELVACTLVTFWLARHLVTPLSHRWLLWLLFEWLGRPVSCKAEGCAERMAAHMHKQRDVHEQNATQNMPHTYRHLFFTSALHEWF